MSEAKNTQGENVQGENVQGETLIPSQAAVRLGVTKTWIYQLIREGRLQATKRSTPAGDYWEIRVSDLDAVRGLKKTGRPPKEQTSG